MNTILVRVDKSYFGVSKCLTRLTQYFHKIQHGLNQFMFVAISVHAFASEQWFRDTSFMIEISLNLTGVINSGILFAATS